MPLMRCPHCGEDTLTIAGWADVDHCANCGRPLVGRPIKLGEALKVHRQLPRRQASGAGRPRAGAGGSTANEMVAGGTATVEARITIQGNAR